MDSLKTLNDRILITGATGFIGNYLVSYLSKTNQKIRVLLRDPVSSHTFPKNVEIYIGDLTQPATLLGVCANVNTVFHLAGYAHTLQTKKNFHHLHHSINFLGTKNLIDKAIGARVNKFIYFSSVKVVAENDHEIDETWNVLSTSAYGKAKHQAEKYVLSAKQKMHVCVLRPSLVYGPKWKGNLASLLSAIDRGFFPPVPKIKNKRSMVSVVDICQAALLAANSPQANGQIYIVTDNQKYSSYQLYSLFCQALGKPLPKWSVPLGCFKLFAWIGDIIKKFIGFSPPFNTDVFQKLFGNADYNSNRIKNELGFIPIYTLESMLPSIIHHYRSNNRKYKNHG